jgi:hypothetical protein
MSSESRSDDRFQPGVIPPWRVKLWYSSFYATHSEKTVEASTDRFGKRASLRPFQVSRIWEGGARGLSAKAESPLAVICCRFATSNSVRLLID